jgi:hypothetical protein
MSIQGKVNELNSIKTELKNLRDRGSVLRKKAKDIEEDIEKYLDMKDQPGLKYKGTAIIREMTMKRLMKKKADARTDAIYVLEKYGVEDPSKVFDEVMDARKGDPTEKSKLKFKKYKK